MELLYAEFVFVHFPAYIAFVISFCARASLGDDNSFEIFAVEAFTVLLSSGVFELSSQEAVVYSFMTAVSMRPPAFIV